MFDKRRLLTLLYPHRRVVKRGLTLVNRVLPRPLSRRVSAAAEKLAFLATPGYQGDTLPPIFHYWSRRYLAPKLASLGLESPEQLYFRESLRHASAHGGRVSILSLGSGAAHMEVALLARLLATGIDARIECIDFNPGLKSIADAEACRHGVQDALSFRVADCNALVARGTYDIVIVNQFFHHVENLEGFCGAIRAQLAPGGRLLTCDVIGRNGHALWPSVDRHVQRAWRTLEESRRFDRNFNACRHSYASIDHAAYSNEGIRAQDIVACLLRHFEFELFVSYGARIMPFVERRVGFNFDPALESDRIFIDRVADADETAIAAGEYPASNMVAVLGHRGTVADRCHVPVSPHEHVRSTHREIAFVQSTAGRDTRRIAA